MTKILEFIGARRYMGLLTYLMELMVVALMNNLTDYQLNCLQKMDGCSVNCLNSLAAFVSECAGYSVNVNPTRTMEESPMMMMMNSLSYILFT